jgi:hypothetical protein
MDTRTLTKPVPSDLKYEYYTVTLDSVGQTSANTFTCYLTQPIRNIVEAKLIAAHIKTTEVTEHCYVTIEELDSKYMERTSNVYEGQPGMTQIRNSFASLVSDSVSLNPSGNDSVILFKDEYPVESQYTFPIGSVDRFRVKIYDQRGRTLTNPVITAGNNFIVIRLKCEITAQGVKGFNPDAPQIPLRDEGSSLSEKIKELRTLLETREIDKETFENIKQKLLDDYLS